MYRHILNSGLPDMDKHIIIGARYSRLLDSGIRSLGLEPVYMPSNPLVDERLSGHADLSVFHPGAEKLLLAPYLENTEFHLRLRALGLECIFARIKQGCTYPHDTQLNACVVGSNLFYSKGISCDEIEKLCPEMNYISVKQAYCGCSICVVDEDSIITADTGIAVAAKNAGIDVLRISPGYIKLDGFSYGFIGGSAFKISKNCMAFTGTLNGHPDRERIISFLHGKDVSAEFITDLPIFDIGNGIFITEK